MAPRSLSISIAALALALALAWAPARAGLVYLAAAANFTAAMKEIAADFETASGHRVVVSYGSTGKLYTQILHGAPFEVFLAADQRRPAMLEANGSATERFTYAIGKLVLWTRERGQPIDQQRLIDGDFKKLAIANPKTAPYGAAAVEVMRNLGLYERLEPKLVIGDSIAQTHQFAATGNAELGFVALSQTVLDASGSSWLVPEDGYTEIRQDAVLLEKGRANPVALALVEYLKGDAGRAVIKKFGYGTD